MISVQLSRTIEEDHVRLRAYTSMPWLTDFRAGRTNHPGRVAETVARGMWAVAGMCSCVETLLSPCSWSSGIGSCVEEPGPLSS
jgi:hypothetical protein